MKSEAVEKFLTVKGFKRYDRGTADSDTTVSNYYLIPYGVEGLPLCLSNEKPPQLWVREWHVQFDERSAPFHGFDFGIRNEAPQGWIDFKFYSINEEDFFAGYDDMEAALLGVWRVLFELKTVKQAEAT